MLGTRIPLLDIVVIAIVAAGIYLYFFKTKKRPNLKSFWPLGLFVAIAVISWLVALPGLPGGEALSAAFYLFRLIAYMLLPLAVVTVGGVNPGVATRQLLYAFLVFAVLGFIQLAVLPDLSILEHLGWDPHQNRLFSTLFDPNFAGFIIGAGATLALIVFLRFKSFISPIESGVILSILLIAELLTFSRTGLLAMVIMIGVVLWHYQKKWLIAFVLALVLLFAASPRLQSRITGIWNLDDTAKHRVESWLQAVNIIQEKPLLGVGYNTLPTTRMQYALPGSTDLVFRATSGFDSSLLTIAATTGLLGLLAFFNLILFALRRGIKHLADPSPFPLWLLSLTLGLLVAAWFVNAWLYPPILGLWLLALSLSSHDHTD